ncbi:MAG: Hsp20/alpha crystallin family protein [Patescibacteria group bacterium]
MANMIRWDPFGEIYSLRDTVNRMFGNQPWQPLIDILDKQDRLLLRADLPGVDQKDLEVTVDEDSVTIKGEARAEQEEEKDNYYRRERSFGSFTRVVPLSEMVNPQEAQATFRNGLLEIVMPKAEHAKPKARRLEIQ